MKLLSPTQHTRLNEVVGFLLLLAGLALLLSLVSYHAQDPSLNTASNARPLNLVGYPGAYLADIFYQCFGATAYLFPLLIFALSWKWIHSDAFEAGGVKVVGAVLLTLATSAVLSFLPWQLYSGTIRIGGVLGLLLANYLVNTLNVAGALMVTLTAVVISLYLVSTFTLALVGKWFAAPAMWIQRRMDAWSEWRERVHQRSIEKAKEKAEKRKASAKKEREQKAEKTQRLKTETVLVTPGPSDVDGVPWEETTDRPPLHTEPEPVEEEAETDIPICQIEDLDPIPDPLPLPVQKNAPEPVAIAPVYKLPSTGLLNEAPGRNAFDEAELKETAGKIKSKFEEFSVLGNVVQINPGPVVTTFEFKPASSTARSRTSPKTCASDFRPNQSSSNASPASPPSALKCPTHAAS
jgi:DNA segregation ATPase FtsK/SpoIIIE, S-DNA-T family